MFTTVRSPLGASLLAGVLASLSACDARQLTVDDDMTVSGLCTVIADPAYPLNGYEQFPPEQKMADPRAQSSDYVYLVAGREAVAIAGPAIPFAESAVTVQAEGITVENPTAFSADGFRVSVNDHLFYQVRIEDFEHEVALARVELCPTGGQLQSRFVFPATGELGGGVAHRLTIEAMVDGISQASSPPLTVEVR
jgi:hypothetical protein